MSVERKNNMIESSITMTKAEKLIFEKLTEIEKKINLLIEKREIESIEEISIGKAAKLMRIGAERITGYINSGKLKARAYRDKNKVKRYRVRIADIRTFQENQSIILPAELPIYRSGEDIAKEIFGHKTKRKE